MTPGCHRPAGHACCASIPPGDSGGFRGGTGRYVVERRGGKDLEAVIEQRFTTGGIAQGAPDDHFEVLGHALHYLRRQRRLADAALTQYAHHSTAFLDHPRREQVQFPLATIEGRDGGRVAPIDARPIPSWRSEGADSSTGLLACL